MDHITVDFEKFEALYKIAKRKGLKELTFEFVVGSCFPDIFNNVQEEMRRQFTMGYIAGQRKETIPNEKKNQYVQWREV